MPCNVVIVGAGISGLATAVFVRHYCKDYSVSIYEASSSLSEAGAGVQIPPNSFLLLDRIGLGDRLRDAAAEPASVIIRNYREGEIIKETSLVPQMVKAFGSPYLLIHRAKYQQLLCEAAVEAGVSLNFGCPVASVDENTTTMVLKDGQRISADLIVGADGIRSCVRSHIDPVLPSISPYCAYRALIPRNAMLSSEHTAEMMSGESQNIWLGPSRHIVGYPIGASYNVVAISPGHASLGKWNEPCDPSEVHRSFESFDKSSSMLLEHIEKPTKWLLADLPPLRRWSSASGKIVLVGDAAHAMLPFLAQGAAQAIESSAVLAICLARVSIAEAIPEAISAYEAIRKPRVKRISFASRENGNVWHLEERPEQDARDAALKMGSIFVRGRFKEKGPRSEDEQEIQMELATGKFQARVFGFDAISDANDKLEQMGVPSINRP